MCLPLLAINKQSWEDYENESFHSLSAFAFCVNNQKQINIQKLDSLEGLCERIHTVKGRKAGLNQEGGGGQGRRDVTNFWDSKKTTKLFWLNQVFPGTLLPHSWNLLYPQTSPHLWKREIYIPMAYQLEEARDAESQHLWSSRKLWFWYKHLSLQTYSS